MKSYIILLLGIIFLSCTSETKITTLKKGTYRATLQIQDHEEIPFIFNVVSKNELHVFNAEEVIKVHEISYKNDSVKIQMPFFEGYITAKIDNQQLLGTFVKPSLQRIVPFKATLETERFKQKEDSQVNITGNWETIFSPNVEKDSYIAKGIFNQKGNKVTGTFRTTTGDYRFLEGIINGNELQLSTFDGAHAFLFKAQVTDATMNGYFYSGNHWKEPFTAKRNDNYELPDATSLTYLKKGYDTFEFSFPDKNDTLISLKNERFKNKVTVIQIMGSWCPNCLDESKFYAEYYNKNKSKGIEFVALAFEVAKTKKDAFELLNRLQEQIGISYPILLAQYGSSDKISAQEKLPMLNHVLSYPTTIIIDKKGKVRKIHTGFNGPATGKLYTDFTTEFDSFLNDLLSE